MAQSSIKATERMMAKHEKVRIPVDFKEAVKALLQTPPPPPGDPSTRKKPAKKRGKQRRP